MQIIFKLKSGVVRDPTRVAGLVAIGMTAVAHGAIYDGLALHAWNDAQLAEIQEGIGQTDFLENYQFVTRGEAVIKAVPRIEYFEKLSSRSLIDYFSQPDSAEFMGRVYATLWPKGWFDQSKSGAVENLLRRGQTVDSAPHRAYPDVAENLERGNEASKSRWDAEALWNVFVQLSSFPDSMAHFAQAQVMVDQIRLDCALERYRLAQGAYPPALDSLVPLDIASLPCDVMNGEPYHYRLLSRGGFLLYSVGWNQKDEGGKVAYERENPRLLDYKNGDWGWPTPIDAAAP